MRARTSSVALALTAGLALSAGVGAHVVGCVGEPTAFPCTLNGVCLAGYQCVSGACVACPPDKCVVSRTTLVSTGGGLACDDDGTCVRFPPGALFGTTEITVERTASPTDNIGATAVSPVYAIRPTTLPLNKPVEIVFRVSRQIDSRTMVTIQRAFDPNATWESLDTQRTNNQATASSNTLGFFALGRMGGGGGGDGGVGPASNPIPGISMGQAITAPVNSLHGITWDASLERMMLADNNSGTIYSFAQRTAMADQPGPALMGRNRPYGLASGPNGLVLFLELGTRSISSAAGMAEPAVIVDLFEDLRFNGPADAAVRQDGTIYFTDPGVGPMLTQQPRDLEFNGVFRVAPDTLNVTAEWQGPITSEPRGIELSPSESTLYVADNANAVVLAWDVLADGTLSNQRTFVSTRPGADGLAVDSAGNLYVGTMEGIEVFAPNGQRWGLVALNLPVNSLAFGGPGLGYLYAMANNTLYPMTVTTPGVR